MAEQKTISKFDTMLSQGRVHDAIRFLRNRSERNLTWEITDDINKVDDAYGYLLKYAVDGVDDPQRRQIYDDLVSRLAMLSARLERALRLKKGGDVYCDAVRQVKGRSVSDAVRAYREAASRNGFFARAASGDQSGSVLETEARETDLFDTLWTAFPLHSEDYDIILEFLSDTAVAPHVKHLAISALTLGNLEYADQRRAMLLAEAYRLNISERLSMVALTGLLLSLFVNRHSRMGKPLADHLNALRDLPQWRSDIKSVFLELIRTRDTDRITRKLRDEIVPEMLKIKPEIDKTLRNRNLNSIDITDMEENPEWQEILERSGIADKMKEMTEIQEEGGDVLMATFAHLKSFPFFYRVANWFMPYHAEHSAVGTIGDDANIVSELIADSTFMCDSDKYSFILALNTVPQQQRDLMLSQLKGQNLNAAELRGASMMLGNDTRRNIINKYVQNLYRFFRLFRRKGDFTDPFESEINLTQLPLLADDFSGDDTLMLVGEFYFKHGYYAEAIGVFRVVERTASPDASLYQKMGFCEQKLGDIPQALKYYEQAELLNARSEWTLKRIAACHRLMGNFTKALEYYKRLDQLRPDNASTAINMGQCCLALHKYEDALKYFYKADYLRPGDRRTERLLAWSLLMTADYESADLRYEALLSDRPEAADLLNAGHLAMARGRYRDAIDRYSAYVDKTEGGFEAFISAMKSDEDELHRLMVNAEMLPLVIDAVSYRVEK